MAGRCTRFPVRPYTGISELVLVVESCFDEDAPVADGDGVLGDERPLLRESGRRGEQEEGDGKKMRSRGCSQ